MQITIFFKKIIQKENCKKINLWNLFVKIRFATFQSYMQLLTTIFIDTNVNLRKSDKITFNLHNKLQLVANFTKWVSCLPIPTQQKQPKNQLKHTQNHLKSTNNISFSIYISLSFSTKLFILSYQPPSPPGSSTMVVAPPTTNHVTNINPILHDHRLVTHFIHKSNQFKSPNLIYPGSSVPHLCMIMCTYVYDACTTVIERRDDELMIKTSDREKMDAGCTLLPLVLENQKWTSLSTQIKFPSTVSHFGLYASKVKVQTSNYFFQMPIYLQWFKENSIFAINISKRSTFAKY